MNKKSIGFKLVDALLILMMILPLVGAMALQVMTKPASDGVAIAGARIFFTIHMPIQDLPITESQVNTWLIMISLFFLCLFLTHGLTEKCESKRQAIAEWIVEKTDDLVKDNMGEYFKEFSPFVCGIMALSVFSSLSSMLGIFPPTSDINVVAGWAVIVFILITHYKLKGGFFNYLKSFTEPVPVLTPFNIISEFATPVSMSFRHYGNVLSGSVISALVGTGASYLRQHGRRYGHRRTDLFRAGQLRDTRSGNHFAVFRHFQRMYAGVHFCNAHDDLCFGRIPD